MIKSEKKKKKERNFFLLITRNAKTFIEHIDSSAKLPKQRAEICTQQEDVFVRRPRNKFCCVLGFLYYVFDSPFRPCGPRPFLRLCFFIVFPFHFRTDPTPNQSPDHPARLLSRASERYVGAWASRAGGHTLAECGALCFR
jgi:hypothetical protein